MALSFGADGREVLSCDATLLSDSATRCCRDAGLVRVEDGRLLQEEYVFGRQYHGGARQGRTARHRTRYVSIQDTRYKILRYNMQDCDPLPPKSPPTR